MKPLLETGYTFWIAFGQSAGLQFSFHKEKSEPTLIRLVLWKISFVIARYDVEIMIADYAGVLKLKQN